MKDYMFETSKNFINAMPRGNPLDSENCRSCSSFSDYFKATKQKLKHDSKNEEISNLVDNQLPERPMRPDCPLDKDQLGTSTWGLLHTMAAKYPVKPTKEDKEGMKQFLIYWENSILASRVHMILEMNDPPRLNNQQEFSHWLCQLHNKVNLKLDKPEFDCSKVNERWRDGWLDGSCD